MCHIIYTEIGDNSPEFDDNFYSKCESVCKLFGFSRLDYIDIDFIFNLFKLNDFSEKTPNNVEKPKINNFSFEYDEFSNQYVRNTYRHSISSYNIDDDNIIDLIKLMENDGNFDYYDGNNIDSEIIDSEVTDIKLDKNSIYKKK